MSAKPSLFSNEKECFICHSPYVECHHIYPSGRRPISDREGCTVYLCHEHHQGRMGVHNDSKLQRFFRSDCQRRWEEREGLPQDNDHSDFIAVFGESYL